MNMGYSRYILVSPPPCSENTSSFRKNVESLHCMPVKSSFIHSLATNGPGQGKKSLKSITIHACILGFMKTKDA